MGTSTTPRRERVTRSGSATVVGDDLLWTDVWATALFVGGDPARAAFASQAPGWRAFER